MLQGTPVADREDSNGRHVGALLKKTLKVKRRKPLQLGCDYIFPLVLGNLVVLYSLLSPAAKTHIYAETPNSTDVWTPEFPITLTPTVLANLAMQPPDEASARNYSFMFSFVNGKPKLGAPGEIVLVGKSDSEFKFVNDLHDLMFSTECNKTCLVDIGETKQLCGQELFCPKISISRNESAAEDRYKLGEKIWGAVVATNVTYSGETLQHVELILRLPSDKVPTTAEKTRGGGSSTYVSIPNLERTISKWVPWDTTKYFQSGFVYLQDALHRRLAAKYAANAPRLEPLVEQALPHQEYKRAGDYSVFGQYFMMMLMPFAANMAKEMLIEKEKKIRDAMVIMGMRSATFWTGWIVSALLLSLPIVLIQIGFQIFAFGNAPRWCSVLSTFVFWASTIALVFTMYALCPKANFGTIGIVLHMYVSSIVYNILTQSIKQVAILKLLGVLFPSVAFVESCAQLAAGFSSLSSMDNHAGYSFEDVMIVQLMGLLLYSFLGWYHTVLHCARQSLVRCQMDPPR
jgi:hypothetical protein